MTEEIIIDGVNVAECPHRKKEVTFMNVIKCYNYGACEGVNCLYKQHKRLEQENEQLKKQYNCYACDTCNGKEDYRNMKRHCDNAIKTVHKYSLALNEIRKIAEDVEDASSIRFYRIKRKINEVLNDT